MIQTQKYNSPLRAILAVVMFLNFAITANCELRPVTARDCVQVRSIIGVWMNKQGSRVAYLVQAPNLEENHNDLKLYVQELRSKQVAPSTMLVSGTGIEQVSWLADGIHLAMLVSDGGGKKLIIVDSATASQESVLGSLQDIDGYSMDASGSTIAYSVSESRVGNDDRTKHTKDEIADGYRITFGAKPAESYPRNSVFLVRRTGRNWSPPYRVSMQDPLTGERFNRIRSVSHLSLSPNGKLLALNFYTDSPVKEWGASPWIQYVLERNTLQRILALIDLETHDTSLGFKTVFPDSEPLWSADSKSFLLNAHSPVGSKWEQEDILNHRTSSLDANLFEVEVATGNVEEIRKRVPSHHDGPLLWRADGDIVVQLTDDSIARLRKQDGVWQQVSSLSIPRNPQEQLPWLASDGDKVVGIRESISTPGNLFIYRVGEGRADTITDLNPELQHVRFADVREVSWKTPEGFTADGLLFMPPNYDPTVRYPLVIQTKGDQGWFTCDSGANHDPSFAPQPIASAGIMYLARTTKEGYNFEDELSKTPKGYPGGIGFPVMQMDIWDSAVQSLSEQGLIDPKKVGIIGFSATGFHVEFLLTHSNIHYAAATVADNAQYSLGEYWLVPPFSDALEAMYGGPPYGPSLENWRKYSISFNVERIHTPLLMEVMGEGIPEPEGLGLLQRNLTAKYEVFKALTRLNRPVEMYFYPNEQHTPDDPRARLATLQRNVDWYRFWLQGYEDDDVKKKDQYLRWRRFRTLQEDNDNIGLKSAH